MSNSLTAQSAMARELARRLIKEGKGEDVRRMRKLSMPGIPCDVCGARPRYCKCPKQPKEPDDEEE